jgi:SPP1 gp7 family putative phage head morphogenesis protein
MESPGQTAPADPVRFHEAIDAFRRRVPMTKDQWDELDDAQREQAFTVAGVAQADLVSQVYEAIDSAIENGDDIDDFKARVSDMLAGQWGGDSPSRVETIFRTNLSSAYNAGRHAVFSAPAVKEARPYFRYEAIDDAELEECDICAPCLGVVLPQDDPWWSEHMPPQHFNCRCSFSAISAEEAGENDDAVDEEGPDVDADDGFGDRPSETGADWDGPDLGDYPAAISDVLRDVLANR